MASSPGEATVRTLSRVPGSFGREPLSRPGPPGTSPDLGPPAAGSDAAAGRSADTGRDGSVPGPALVSLCAENRLASRIRFSRTSIVSLTCDEFWSAEAATVAAARRTSRITLRSPMSGVPLTRVSILRFSRPGLVAASFDNSARSSGGTEMAVVPASLSTSCSM